jgi:GAF domain-containing protein
VPDDAMLDRLAHLARTFESQDDVAAATHEVCKAAVEIVDGAAVSAGITLVRRRRRVETVAATSDLARNGDDLQYELGEGPCLDAAWEEPQVYAGDLRHDARWPTWGPRVVKDLGVNSMLCTQLFTNENTLGALNVYAADEDAFDSDDRDNLRLLGAHAAVAVAAAQQIDSLKIAVDRRTTTGTAIGIVMERYGVTNDQALALLRRLSQDENRKLADIAHELVDAGNLRPSQRNGVTRENPGPPTT